MKVIILMIPNREGCHYILVKALSALLRGIISKYDDEFNCLNCFHSFTKKNKLESSKKVCENKYFCNAVIPSKDTKVLEFNQDQKSDKTQIVIYEYLESLIEKIDRCKNNPEKSFTKN